MFVSVMIIWSSFLKSGRLNSGQHAVSETSLCLQHVQKVEGNIVHEISTLNT
jgi:hypothetical protein